MLAQLLLLLQLTSNAVHWPVVIFLLLHREFFPSHALVNTSKTSSLVEGRNALSRDPVTSISTDRSGISGIQDDGGGGDDDDGLVLVE